MKTKLTLSIDKDTTEKAKRYAKKRGKSLSKLIESYLRGLDADRKPSIVDGMVGIVKLKKGETVESIIKRAIVEKHLR